MAKMQLAVTFDRQTKQMKVLAQSCMLISHVIFWFCVQTSGGGRSTHYYHSTISGDRKGKIAVSCMTGN